LDSSEAAQDQVPDEVDDFFDYATRPLSDAAVNAVEKECINYLSDTDTELMLSRYTLQNKTVFTKYNTTLFVSCSSRKTFITAGQIKVPRRNL